MAQSSLLTRTSGPAGRAIGRRTLPNAAAYTLAAAVIGVCLFASVVPSPLYQSYAALWHFSPLTLTLVFATYAFGVLAALLIAGRISDEVGRRPVLLASIGMLMVSALIYIGAAGTWWLFAARGVQGLATGAAVSTASAALLDLHVRHDPVRVGLTNGVASATGLGVGSLVSALLVQTGVAPRTLPYVVVLTLFAVAFAGTYWMPEPVAERSVFRLTPQRPRVPAPIRHPFLLAGLATMASWSVGGLFFSIGARLPDQLFGTSNVIVGALAGVLLGLGGAIAQLLFHRSAPWLGASLGSLGLAAGMVLIVIAASSGSGILFVVGALAAGFGFGLAFLGGLRQLVAVIPPEHRASVMAAFYLVAYASLSLPAVIAGLTVTRLGLDTTIEIFGSVVAAIATIVAVEAWRTQPGRQRRATASVQRDVEQAPV